MADLSQEEVEITEDSKTGTQAADGTAARSEGIGL